MDEQARDRQREAGERAALRRAARRAGRVRDRPPGAHVPAAARSLPAVPDPAGRRADRDPVRASSRSPCSRTASPPSGAARRGRGGRVHGRPRRLVRRRSTPSAREALMWVWRHRYLELGARDGGRVRVHLREPGRRGRRDAPPPPRPDLRATRSCRRCRRGSSQADARLGGCAPCELLRRELEDGRRVVYENEAVVVYVPYAARWAYEAHVVLRAHRPSLLECEAGELDGSGGRAAGAGARLRRVCSTGPSRT